MDNYCCKLCVVVAFGGRIRSPPGRGDRKAIEKGLGRQSGIFHTGSSWPRILVLGDTSRIRFTNRYSQSSYTPTDEDQNPGPRPGFPTVLA